MSCPNEYPQSANPYWSYMHYSYIWYHHFERVIEVLRTINHSRLDSSIGRGWFGKERYKENFSLPHFHSSLIPISPLSTRITSKKKKKLPLHYFFPYSIVTHHKGKRWWKEEHLQPWKRWSRFLSDLRKNDSQVSKNDPHDDQVFFSEDLGWWAMDEWIVMLLGRGLWQKWKRMRKVNTRCESEPKWSKFSASPAC